MSLENASLLYLGAFRLSLVASGAFCVYLGYRLFVRGVWGRDGPASDAEIQAEIAGSRFTVRNAAPGVVFALVGLAIVSANFTSGGPELTLSRVQEISEHGEAMRTEARMKGQGEGDSEDVASLTRRGIELEKARKPEAAALEYTKAAVRASEALNNLASILVTRGEAQRALQLSGAAIELVPERASFLHTHAQALAAAGRRDAAVKIMTRAAEADPRYRDDLNRLEGEGD